MVVCTFNLSPWEAGAGRFLTVLGQPGDRVKPRLKDEKTKHSQKNLLLIKLKFGILLKTLFNFKVYKIIIF